MSTHTPKEKLKARSLCAAAIRAGKIIRPKACSKCRSKLSRVQAHHTDYSKPFEVEWLCQKCHDKAHKGDQIPVYTVRVPLLVSKAQQKRLVRISQDRGWSVGSLLRSLIPDPESCQHSNLTNTVHGTQCYDCGEVM